MSVAGMGKENADDLDAQFARLALVPRGEAVERFYWWCHDGALAPVQRFITTRFVWPVELTAGLRYAAAFGHVDVVGCLLDVGADAFEERQSALCLASCGGHADVVKRILQSPAAACSFLLGSLLAAVSANREHVVEAFISSGLLSCKDLGTALASARRNRRAAVAQLLSAARPCGEFPDCEHE